MTLLQGDGSSGKKYEENSLVVRVGLEPTNLSVVVYETTAFYQFRHRTSIETQIVSQDQLFSLFHQTTLTRKMMLH
jgi:hypothetical protein